MTEPGRAYERRIVTVVFADLVGFTSLAERLDAEDLAAIQDRYFGTVRETVARYGGVVEKFIGDAAMAAFGIPAARDNDAERAVRAAFAVASAVDRLGAQIGLDSAELAVRIGATTGEVVYAEAGPDQGRLTGDVVNTAARLQVAAPPGRVLVDQATALAIAEAVEVGPLEPHELKGKAEPVLAALAISVRPERSRELAMGGLRAPILGRADELARLAQALEAVRRGRAGARWLVLAPPGTGKTRLLEEFAGRASATGVAVDHVRFRVDDPRPFGALADLFRPDDVERLRSGGGMPPGRSEVVAAAIQYLLAGEGTPGVDRQLQFDAWLDGLTALRGGRPALWLAEDVHWAGPDALAFLDAALLRTGSGGRLVVASARPSLLERAPDWCAASPAVGRLDLAGLATTDAAALVCALVGDALPDALAARIAGASYGNPLYIEELLRTWVGVGVLRRDTCGWVLAAPADEVHVPTTVQAIYAAQLDDLPPEPRRIVRRGSVAGRRLPAGALESLGVDDPGPALASLVRRALLDGPVEEVIVGDAYVYRHALLRDAGYASLARAERAALHVRMARWLETVAGPRADAVAEAIGDHYVAAADCAPALAPDVGDGLTRPAAAVVAASWLERAGEAALAAGAQAAAVDLFVRAVDRTDPAAALDLSRRSRRAGEVSALVGSMDVAARRLGDAMTAARAAREATAGRDEATAAREALALAAASLSRIVAEQLRFEEAWGLAETVLEEVGPAEDPPAAWLELRAATARMLFTDAPEELARVARRASTVAAAAGRADLELEALAAAMQAAASPRELVVAARELVPAARRAGRWDLVVRGLRIEASQASELGGDPAPLLEEAVDIAASRGLTEALGWVHYTRSEVAFRAGNWRLARAAGLAALEIAERRAYHRICARAWLVLVPVGRWTADHELLRRARDWFVENEERLPDSPYGRLVYAAVDVALAAAGVVTPPDLDPHRLLPSFDADLEMPHWNETVDTVVRRWLDEGERDAAREAILRCRRHVGSHPTALATGALALLSARYARASGRRVRAAREARAALAAFESALAPWWVAKALRLLEDVGSASEDERARARSIEVSLGVTGRAS